MAFMEPEITEYQEWCVVDFGHHEWQLVPSDYVTADMVVISREMGHGARLSAHGYMDCTEWGVYDTEEEARQGLAETYDLCPVCLVELDEDYVCQDCLKEKEEDDK
jgi:hypothetical protein